MLGNNCCISKYRQCRRRLHSLKKLYDTVQIHLYCCFTYVYSVGHHPRGKIYFCYFVFHIINHTTFQLNTSQSIFSRQCIFFSTFEVFLVHWGSIAVTRSWCLKEKKSKRESHHRYVDEVGLDWWINKTLDLNKINQFFFIHQSLRPSLKYSPHFVLWMVLNGWSLITTQPEHTIVTCFPPDTFYNLFSVITFSAHD